MTPKHCKIPAQTPPIDHFTLSSITGDKSVSHRAVIMASLSDTPVTIHNFLASDDCLNTAEIMRQMGVSITHDPTTQTLTVIGKGLHGLTPPSTRLNVGNSGTSIRLLTGLLCAQPFSSQIAGDASIAKRPMKRVVTPLTQMGANITGVHQEGKSDIFPPLTIAPSTHLNGIHYEMPVASAQVKSAILLAGLYANSPTTIIEHKPSRDHTERMFKNFGISLTQENGKITLIPPKALTPPTRIRIPSDFSSASFLIVLAAIIPGYTLTLKNIGLNPTRKTLLDILLMMDADITVTLTSDTDAEPTGDIFIRGRRLKNIQVPASAIPFMIDEIPILSVAALLSDGPMTITDAEELRVKESDRIKAIVALVQSAGGQIIEHEDGFILHPLTTYRSFSYSGGHDHRMAMSAIILAIATSVTADVQGCEYISTSFPNFFDLLTQLRITHTLS